MQKKAFKWALQMFLSKDKHEKYNYLELFFNNDISF